MGLAAKKELLKPFNFAFPRTLVRLRRVLPAVFSSGFDPKFTSFYYSPKGLLT